jgi:hypothetical protein
LLQKIGISADADSVDFLSLDGFEGTFTMDELRREWPQGAPVGEQRRNISLTTNPIPITEMAVSLPPLF